ncbi:uncharacterized protein LOC143441385 [Arvicanthis niloticus]|uniref:uncharacterized protein LOC143311602 n=1 Tax=Arvicanthis niloticus TaxID=61156 RepID=UPI00402BE4A5
MHISEGPRLLPGRRRYGNSSRFLRFPSTVRGVMEKCLSPSCSNSPLSPAAPRLLDPSTSLKEPPKYFSFLSPRTFVCCTKSGSMDNFPHFKLVKAEENRLEEYKWYHIYFSLQF